jgi:hypothetical protein|tara:strand:+ start:2766 stop:3155 length:390 start_codon:yes stop_codon:yes gene_type:complete
MEKHTLTFVRNEDKISKNGKPYTRCSIKVEKLGDLFINGFGNDITKTWQVGDEVEVRLFDEEYEGKTYKKFEAQKPTAAALSAISELKESLATLQKDVVLLMERISKLEDPPSKEKFDDFLNEPPEDSP